MGVSVPVDWPELSGLSSGAHWTIRTIDERLIMSTDPWPDYGLHRPSLKQAIRALAVEQAC